jgi:hypothetical protein
LEKKARSSVGFVDRRIHRMVRRLRHSQESHQCAGSINNGSIDADTDTFRLVNGRHCDALCGTLRKLPCMTQSDSCFALT